MRYLQLAHNEWDAAKGRSVPRVIYGFGREDELDKEAVRRLVASLSRLLEPGNVPAAPGEGLEFAESRPYGGAYVAGPAVAAARDRGDPGRAGVLRAGPAAGRRRGGAGAVRAGREPGAGPVVEAGGGGVDEPRRAHRRPAARCPTTRATGRWTGCTRSAASWRSRCTSRSRTFSTFEVDLLFFDTTSTYFEAGEADEEVARDWRGEKPAGQGHASGDQAGSGGDEENPAGRPAGFRAYGKSKDPRDDLPQVVIGLAVTREGIPVRVWCWPGNTADSALIRQVKNDMRDWSLGRVIWVADRGFTSKENRRYLQQGGGAYIIGEKLRSGSAEAQAALSRQGRYKNVAGNLQVKEVRLARRRRPVRHLLQPRPGRPRRRRPREDDRPARRAHRRHRQAQRRRSGPSCAGRSPPCRA